MSWVSFVLGIGMKIWGWWTGVKQERRDDIVRQQQKATDGAVNAVEGLQEVQQAKETRDAVYGSLVRNPDSVRQPDGFTRNPSDSIH